TVAARSVTFCSMVSPSGTVVLRLMVAKPESSNVTVYSPGGRLGNTYAPLLSETFERGTCSAGDVTETVTPGTARPCSSWTMPRIVPVCTPCAASEAAQPQRRSVNTSRRANVIDGSPSTHPAHDCKVRTMFSANHCTKLNEQPCMKSR